VNKSKREAAHPLRQSLRAASFRESAATPGQDIEQTLDNLLRAAPSAAFLCRTHQKASLNARAANALLPPTVD